MYNLLFFQKINSTNSAISFGIYKIFAKINIFLFSYRYEHLGEEVAITASLAKRLTNRRVFYVGFSLGTTAVFTLCSLKPQFCLETLIGILAMAPIAYLDVFIPSILGPLAPTWPLIAVRKRVPL